MNSTTYGVDEYGNEAEDVRSGYVGEFKKFGFSGVPKHCLACDGSEISRATYSELFKVFGETYGAGDGETTFNLPDFRGAFLRCIGGNAAALGVEQGDAIRNITSGNFGLRPGAEAGTGWLGYTTGGNGCIAVSPQDDGRALVPSAWVSANDIPLAWNFNASRVVPTANENRPINYAVNICVVYE